MVPIGAIGTVMSIPAYLKTLKEYLGPTIRKMRKRVDGNYYEYDLELDNGLLFWRDVLNTDFYNFSKLSLKTAKRCPKVGDIIEFHNANVSRWVPLFPGKMCSVDGKQPFDEHEQYFPKDHDYGIEEELFSRNNSWVMSGSATVRLLPFGGQYLISCAGKFCDVGIPIVISKSMYEEKLQSLISREGCVNAKVSGVLSELPGEWKTRVDKNILNKIDASVYGLPRIVLKVEDIRDVGTPPKDVHATAWTQFVRGMGTYGSLMRSLFLLTKPDDLQKAVDMVANYKQFLDSGLIGGNWTPNIEFDETKDWFSGKRYTTFAGNGVDFFRLYYMSPFGRFQKPKRE